MALFNSAKREINAKIVYFGPSHTGKSTSLGFIHRKLKPEHRGTLKAMGGQRDRMLFFDFMPPGLGEVNGYRVRFHLYTVQGEVSSSSTWKTVLKGADGIVFVADSSPEGVEANEASMAQLRGYLAGFGQTFSDTPCVVQLSRTDHPAALQPGELVKMMDAESLTAIASVPPSGEGVLQALSAAVKQVIARLTVHCESIAPTSEDYAESVEPCEAAGAAEYRFDAGEDAARETLSPVESLEEVSGMAEPSLEIGGPVESTGDGRLRLPLVVGAGRERRRYVLTIALAAEDAAEQ